MSKRFTQYFLFMALLSFAGGNAALAQEEKTWILDPSSMQPAQDGWFVDGGYAIKNGEEVHFSGCDMEYGDSDTYHQEFGEHEGFEYGRALVMPECEGKGTPPRDDWPVGYLQLDNHMFAHEEDTRYGWLESPTFTNLQSLKVLVGTDLSLHSRDIHIVIETSLDGGETWALMDDGDGFFIRHNIINQGGDELEFVADGDNPDFNAMVEDSRDQPMQFRIIPYPSEPGNWGHRLKIFRIELTASEAEDTPDGGPVTSVKPLAEQAPFYSLKNGTIAATKGQISVLTITGQLVGSGTEINIPTSGLYVIRSFQGRAEKLWIQ